MKVPDIARACKPRANCGYSAPWEPARSGHSALGTVGHLHDDSFCLRQLGMQRKSFADMECNIARSVEEVGDGWSLMILRNALLGAKRFQDFEAGLGAPPTTLTRRLHTLTEQGFFARREYETHPKREEYELTQKGLDFLPVLLALATWGGHWLSPNGAPLEFVDPVTGAAIEPSLVDARTGNSLVAGKVGVRPGPGASAELRRSMTHVRPVFGAAAQGGAL